MSQTDDVLRGKLSNALENNSFAVSFVLLELWREHKKDYREMGESKVQSG